MNHLVATLVSGGGGFSVGNAPGGGPSGNTGHFPVGGTAAMLDVIKNQLLAQQPPPPQPVVTPQPAPTQAPTFNSPCETYQAVEELFRCNQRGSELERYPLEYGYKYCYVFKHLDNLSTSGITWKNETMKCLADSLALYLRQHPGVSCGDIADAAFSSHVGCYTGPQVSFCDLTLSDKARISWAIRGEFMEIFGRVVRGQPSGWQRTWDQIRGVGLVCYPWLRDLLPSSTEVEQIR